MARARTAGVAGGAGSGGSGGSGGVVSVDVPVASPPPGAYCPERVNARLTERQARALKHVEESLVSRHERLSARPGEERGRAVDGPSHAVQWLLDRIADGLEGA